MSIGSLGRVKQLGGVVASVSALIVGCRDAGTVSPEAAGAGTELDSAADAHADAASLDAAHLVDASSVDATALGKECSESKLVCPNDNEVCVDFREVAEGDPELAKPRCTPEPISSHVTCPTGTHCAVADTVPYQPYCDR